jgi:hypothetical protein
MKDCLPLANLVTAQVCAKEVNAASVEARAIACLSMEIRPRCDKNDRSDGKVSVRDSAHAIRFAELLAASRRIGSGLTGVPGDGLGRSLPEGGRPARAKSSACDVLATIGALVCGRWIQSGT